MVRPSWGELFAYKRTNDLKPIPVFAVPILNRGDLLLRLVKSIDYPIEKFCVVNNGQDESVLSALASIESLNSNIKKLVVYTPDKNLGCSASWNKIMADNPSAPYWFVCANDMMFAKAGDLKIYNDFVVENHKTHSMIYADGYSCFCMTKQGLEVIGTFDENYYPAYMEDADHFYRARLIGATTAALPHIKPIHGEPPYHGSSTIFSNENYRKANHATHINNAHYYFQKWGGGGGQEKFKTPFNRPDLSIKDWFLDEKFRKNQEALWQ